MMLTSTIGLVLAVFQCCYACRNGYVRYDDSCYHVSREAETWAVAMYTCRLDNGYLAEISSAKENSFLTQLITGSSTPNAWIGLADFDVEGDWLWWTSKTDIVSFKPWSQGQPDNSAGEDCAKLYSTALWNDVHCNTLNRYICEMPYESWDNALLKCDKKLCLADDVGVCHFSTVIQ